MMNRGKGLGEKIRRNFWNLDLMTSETVGMVIVCRVVGYIPGSVEEGAKDFGLETLDAFDVGWLGRTP